VNSAVRDTLACRRMKMRRFVDKLNFSQRRLADGVLELVGDVLEGGFARGLVSLGP
jgi:hypothetical protein